MVTQKRKPSMVGRNLKRLRGDMSTRELAKAAKVARQTIVGLENGYPEQSNPEQHTLQRLAGALGVTVIAFYREDPAPAPRRKKAS